MLVDLRSDTLTKPTQEMLQAIYEAEVGDDVYGEDPTINALQEKATDMFGMSAAIFCPSGTMCNQIGIRLGTQPQSEVICDQYAHIYLYEAGGIAANSHASVKLIAGDKGRLKATDVETCINPPDMHFPITSLVALENTSNKGGGSCYELTEIDAIHQLCQSHNIRLHLDGARLFNALVATGQSPKDYGKYFDTISICLSKGLGAPVGSLLLLKHKEDYHKALHIRKLMGGGMRQAGYLAAAGLHAINHHIDRLQEDHHRARIIAETLEKHQGITEVLPVQTNIIVFKPDPVWMAPANLINKLGELGVKISNFGGGYVRIVTHLDITDKMVEYVINAIKKL